MSNPNYAICEEDYTIHPVSPGDLVGRDFPWAPRVPMKKLRSGMEYPQLFTGKTMSCPWEETRVRHFGTQIYTDGSKFVGSFHNTRGRPSEGTYTFANGDILTGHFRNWRTSLTDGFSVYGTGRLRLCPNSITMGTFFNKKLNKSFSGMWGLSPAHAPTPGLCYLVESSEEGGYIVCEDHEEGDLTTRAIYYRCGLFFKNFHEWLQWVQFHCDHPDADYDEEPSFPSLAELDLHQDAPEALWYASFKTQVNLLISQ
tara:strand:- start:31 stop:798 length:768 start_codon:yes stop_codon:yes gene_type:complete